MGCLCCRLWLVGEGRRHFTSSPSWQHPSACMHLPCSPTQLPGPAGRGEVPDGAQKPVRACCCHHCWSGVLQMQRWLWQGQLLPPTSTAAFCRPPDHVCDPAPAPACTPCCPCRCDAGIVDPYPPLCDVKGCYTAQVGGWAGGEMALQGGAFLACRCTAFHKEPCPAHALFPWADTSSHPPPHPPLPAPCCAVRAHPVLAPHPQGGAVARR